MKKRKPKAQGVVPTKRRRWVWRLTTVVFTLGVATLLILGLNQVGEFARRQLGPQERYRVSFAQIECDAPPGQDRATFLSEVRYAGHFPETFQILDTQRDTKLRAAFLAHPWVEAVEAVTVEAPHTVRVQLRFRTPALAVRLKNGSVRLVDAHGVLLPHSATPVGLPELISPVAEPQIAAGVIWPDAAVTRAIDLVKSYGAVRAEKATTGWRLTKPNGTILSVGG